MIEQDQINVNNEGQQNEGQLERNNNLNENQEVNNNRLTIDDLRKVLGETEFGLESQIQAQNQVDIGIFKEIAKLGFKLYYAFLKNWTFNTINQILNNTNLAIQILNKIEIDRSTREEIINLGAKILKKRFATLNIPDELILLFTIISVSYNYHNGAVEIAKALKKELKEEVKSDNNNASPKRRGRPPKVKVQ
ncbi:MAG: hypothetical protein ACO2O6_06315 [Candidatus Hydrothermia bacterium]